MKLIKRHQFGGILNSLKQFLNPTYSSDEVPTGPTPPAPGWTKMKPLEVDTPYKGNFVDSVLTDRRLDSIYQTKRNAAVEATKSRMNQDVNWNKKQAKRFGPLAFPLIVGKAAQDIYNNNWGTPSAAVQKERNALQEAKQAKVNLTKFRGYKNGGLIDKYQFGGKRLPTAPPAEQRYAGGKRVINSGKEFNDSVSIRGVEAQSPWYKYPAQIIERIVHSSVDPAFNDTVYAERPSFIIPMNGVVRATGNNYYFGKKQRYSLPVFGGFVHSNYNASTPGEQQEYDTLKRRFNTAWGVAKHQEGGEFKENLNPPTDGVVGEIKRNLRNGWQQSKRISSSIPLNILLAGIGAGATSVNLVNKGKQFANWLVKDENPGLDQLSALGWIGSGPAMGVAMFDPFGWTPDKKNKKEIRKYGTSSRQDRIRKQEDYQNAQLMKHQEGGRFQEDLTPPSRGFLGEMKTNLQQGNEIFGRMVSSTPVQLLLTGITSGVGGMFGPTMKISKTAKELVTNPRNAIRKFSRNLNARKGDPTYRWTKTSGNLREGGAHEYQFPGIGSGTRMKINSAARSEGSGYSAQPTLNANPTYQRASAPAQTPMQRTWNHQRSVPVEAQASRRVMQRNNLIDQARDWRNYIFESPRFGSANFKVIPR